MATEEEEEEDPKSDEVKEGQMNEIEVFQQPRFGFEIFVFYQSFRIASKRRERGRKTNKS
jgi:hypothetical protein